LIEESRIMFRLPKIWQTGILALLIGAAAPASSWAGWLGLRNDLKDTVIVQSSIVAANRRAVPGRFKTMVPGEVAWEAVLLPGNRIIQIYDSNRQLIYQKTIPVTGDVFFSIQSDPKLGILLVPVKAAPQAPGQKPSGQKPK
jgi:hypothetical protein